MKHFSVIYMAPVSVLENWMKTPVEERKKTEENMKAEWNEWLAAHTDTVKNTIGLGRAKRVSTEGVKDVMNGFMLSSYVEAESLDTVAELFRNHPHLGIPGAIIDIMEIGPLG